MRKGFSLVEVAFAVAILAVLLILLVGTLLNAHLATSTSHESVVASAIAEDHLDHLKRGSFPDLESLIGAPRFDHVVREGRTHQIETRAERLSPSPGGADYNVLHLVCTVTWESDALDTGGSPRQAHTQLETQVARAGRY